MSEISDSQLDYDAARKRIQRSRNLVVGMLLGGFVILIFAISIAKMG